MGVPTFYRWLSNKYPKVVRDAVEERCFVGSAGEFCGADLAGPNPSGIEYDNLYVDMNGVVHPCAHPEGGGPLPQTESEMFQNVCDYLDRLVGLVRPRKVLYLCLDGVAPRAKMNQQRSRRYKSALESESLEKAWNELAVSWKSTRGVDPPALKVAWDSNVITPGTEFMDRLANVLRFYVARRMAESTYWRSLTVLLSDSNVPGEGEHKVMAYVREMRGLCSPNTVHCIHGMDADLIMLGLSTHEAHFYIVREAIVDRRSAPGKCTADGNANGPNAPTLPSSGSIKSNPSFRSTWKPIQILQLPVLKEYLAAEFTFPPEELVTQHPRTGQLVHITSDLERHINDFIFMCFFVGNDFLPHLPSLGLQKGSVDMMLILYKHLFPKMSANALRHGGDGYLTDTTGHINRANVFDFTKYLALAEPAIFQDDNLRKQQDARRAQQQQQQDARSSSKRTHRQMTPHSVEEPRPVPRRVFGVDDSASEISRDSGDAATANIVTTDADFVEAVKKLTESTSAEYAEQQNSASTINLGQGEYEEYRTRYYMQKMHVPREEVEQIAQILAENYVRGLQWVLLYYQRGVPSWTWFYPHHYAPLAADIHKYGLAQLNTPLEFDLAAAVTPIEQLMSVLPPRSSSFIPDAFKPLMLSPQSPLADFYPTKFRQDCDGRRFQWQWIARLPFLNLNRLLYWSRQVEGRLSPAEQSRNRLGAEYAFIAPENALLASAVPALVVSSHESVASGDVILKHSDVSGRLQKLTRTDAAFPLPITAESWCDIGEPGFAGFKLDCHIFAYQRPLAQDLHPDHATSKLSPGAVAPPPQLLDADRQPHPPSKGRGPFNVNVATRIIYTAIGGKPYRDYLKREAEHRARDEAARVNVASVIDISNSAKHPRLVEEAGPASVHQQHQPSLVGGPKPWHTGPGARGGSPPHRAAPPVRHHPQHQQQQQQHHHQRAHPPSSHLPPHVVPPPPPPRAHRQPHFVQETTWSSTADKGTPARSPLRTRPLSPTQERYHPAVPRPPPRYYSPRASAAAQYHAAPFVQYAMPQQQHHARANFEWATPPPPPPPPPVDYQRRSPERHPRAYNGSPVRKAPPSHSFRPA